MNTPSKNAQQITWDEFWKSKQDLNKVYPSSPTVLKTALKHIPMKGKKVLEVGAGTARDSLALCQAGAQVVILDFSAQSLSLVQKQIKALPETTLSHQLISRLPQPLRADAFRTPFPDNYFDLVFHQGLLEHFTQPLELLKENHRILKHGGYLLCDVPQTYHIYTLVKKILIFLDRWFAGWETQFTPKELRALSEQVGFKTIHTYGDWMRPSFAYRTLREICLKIGLNLPKYPLKDTLWDRTKDQVLDYMSSYSASQYTQLTIGVLGQKI